MFMGKWTNQYMSIKETKLNVNTHEPNRLTLFELSFFIYIIICILSFLGYLCVEPTYFFQWNEELFELT